MTKKTKSPWKRLFSLLNLDKSEVSQLYLYAIFSGIVGLSLPLGIQSVIHFIQGGQITTSWVVLVILVIAGVVLTGILQIMQLRITENIQQRIFTRFTFDFAYRFPRLNRLILAKKNPTELMNRFFDIISLQKGIAKVLLDFTSSSLQIIFCLLVLSFYHPFYIAFSISLVLILYLIFKPMIRKGFETSLEESNHKYKTANWLQEIARADWSFRLTPKGNHSLKRLDQHAQAYLSSRESHFKILWKQYLWMITIKAVIVAALLGLGGYLVIDQQMNLGQFVAAEVLILLILGSVEKLIQLLETLYDVFTSLEKIGQLQDLPLAFEESESELDLNTIYPMQVVLYSDPTKPLISINKGDKLILLGGNQQKAVSLLKELVDTSVSVTTTPRWNNSIPSSGMIAALFDRIGWYDSETHLFQGTLRENITMGREELTVVDIEKALKTVGMIDFVTAHSDGYDIQLSNPTKILTVQERERLLIARAIVHYPELLLISFHGLALNENTISTILENIEKEYPAITISAASPFPLTISWNVQSII
jgi:ABC-type bacteriocin/lantibiotic exporter with double-glycine peptidase domain